MWKFLFVTHSCQLLIVFLRNFFFLQYMLLSNIFYLNAFNGQWRRVLFRIRYYFYSIFYKLLTLVLKLIYSVICHEHISNFFISLGKHFSSNMCIFISILVSVSALGKRIRSDIYTGSLLLALSFRRRFPLLFFYPPSLSFCHSARLFTKRSLGSL